MLAHRFCNLSPVEAAEVLAGCALLGQATRVKKAAFDLSKALESAKSMGSSAWESAKSGDPLTLSLAGAAGGGLLGALAGHKKRRGSALTGAMLGALAGGGTGLAMQNWGSAAGPMPQTVEQQRVAAQEAADMSSNAVPPPPGAPGVAGPPVDPAAVNHERALTLKGLLGDRIGAGVYAGSRGHGWQAHDQLIPNQRNALLGAGAGVGASKLLQEIRLPANLKKLGDPELSLYGKGASVPGVGGNPPKKIMEHIQSSGNLRNPFSRKQVVPGFDNALARRSLAAKGGWKGTILRNVLPALTGYAIGGQVPE